MKPDPYNPALSLSSSAADIGRVRGFITSPAGVDVPEGMKAWRGGNTAPGDWDGNEVYGDDGRFYAPDYDGGLDWKHGLSARDIGADIIAYTPIAAAPHPDADGNDPRTCRNCYPENGK